MRGRRIPPGLGLNGRPDLNVKCPTEPGDYLGPIFGYTGDLPAVFFLNPNQHPNERMQHVTSPPHSFIEEGDGSLTIRASIETPPGVEPYWRGYLTRGEWTSV